MRQAAHEYERAAVYRDQLRAVERAQEEQRVSGVHKSDQDVIGFHRQGDQVEVAVLSMRGGRLFGVRTLPLRKVAVPNDEMLGAFLRQHYAERTSLPDEILVPLSIEMSEALEELLSENRKRRVQIVEPKRGAKAKLLDLARENAEHAFAEKERAREDVEARLQDLQRQLRLSTLPRRIRVRRHLAHGRRGNRGGVRRIGERRPLEGTLSKLPGEGGRRR